MDLKPTQEIPVRELLLYPMHLLHQISVALVPGVLALFIVALKHPAIIPLAFSSIGMLGYKTRIVIGLILCFVIGKVVQAAVFVPFRLATTAANKYRREKDALTKDQVAVKNENAAESNGVVVGTLGGAEILPPGNVDPGVVSQEKTEPHPEMEEALGKSTKKAPALTPEQETARHFFGTLVLGTVAAVGPAFDQYEALRAQLGLMLNCGAVLMIASCVPGDGLRLYEGLGGILLFAMGVMQGKDLAHIKIEAIGGAVGRFIAAHSIKENLEILKYVTAILPVITKHINPTSTENEPVKIATEIAEKSGINPSGHPVTRKGRKRHRR